MEIDPKTLAIIAAILDNRTNKDGISTYETVGDVIEDALILYQTAIKVAKTRNFK